MVNEICTVVVLIPLHKPLADRPVGTPILMPFVLLSTLFFPFYFILFKILAHLLSWCVTLLEVFT